ncbi:MAG: 23S rRNA (pseudouridine(1915)-N(3))-methyltransferase RlmH [Gammaproteobacteria bacterium]|nr:23S rRNA (pseudouridine(1915)-N(3))-methyltransferase RlmH [Gammaproteobacteria bacterium]
MHLKVIAVGQRMPSWVSAGADHYLKSMRRFAQCELVEVKAAKGTMSPSIVNTKGIKKETAAVLSHIDSSDHVVTLDVMGQGWSIADIADRITQWSRESLNVVFLIGGANGLSDACRQRANASWALSPSVYPHGLARVMVLEQLFRGLSIVHNHPYHLGH